MSEGKRADGSNVEHALATRHAGACACAAAAHRKDSSSAMPHASGGILRKQCKQDAYSSALDCERAGTSCCGGIVADRLQCCLAACSSCFSCAATSATSVMHDMGNSSNSAGAHSFAAETLTVSRVTSCCSCCSCSACGAGRGRWSVPRLGAASLAAPCLGGGLSRPAPLPLSMAVLAPRAAGPRSRGLSGGPGRRSRSLRAACRPLDLSRPSVRGVLSRGRGGPRSEPTWFGGPPRSRPRTGGPGLPRERAY